MNPKQLEYFMQFVIRKAQIHAIEKERRKEEGKDCGKNYAESLISSIQFN